MMLKVNDEFLDFNDYVEIEKHVKLFERIDETLGDFSYSFELDKTSKNMRILGNPLPDVKNKIIYQEVLCDILDDSGLVLYKGYLRVERITEVIQCSFFSGNYNWFSLLSGQLSDLDLSDLDTDLTESEIINSADNTEGIIFPLIDTGALITRSYRALMVEDFSGCIFVKTLFKRIFQGIGVKTQGDLFKDPIFDNLLLSRNTRAGDDIENRSVFANKTSDQTYTDGVNAKILFQDDSTFPYFDGTANLYNASTSEFIPDYKMRVRVDMTLIYFSDSLVAGGKDFGIDINGSFTSIGSFEPTIAVSNPTYPLLTTTKSVIVTIEAGEVLSGYAQHDPAGSTATLIIKENSTFKVTPIFIYSVSGASLVPEWTQGKFISNILSLFCCITDYEPTSKTLTIDFFQGIKSKQSVDISEYVSETYVDYQEFISEYGKKSLLTYQDGDLESVREYNLKNFVNYGAGQINVNNDFIQDTVTILESDFKSPISYVNEAFGASLERTQYVSLEEQESQDFTGVTDASGEARFAVSDATIYEVGDLVRITDSTNSGYNGEYVVKNVGTGFIHLRGVAYNTDATGVITKLIHVVDSDDGVYLFVNTQYQVENVSYYSLYFDYWFETNSYTNVAYAFFNLLNIGRPVNSYTQGLSFGTTSGALYYQRSLIDTYWDIVSKVLNDPVKLENVANIPKIVFDRINPLAPIRLKSKDTDNIYYLNKISGYKASFLPCQVDIIKLS